MLRLALTRRGADGTRRHFSAEWKRLAGKPEVTPEGVAIVRFDAKGEKMNSLQNELFEELNRGFAELKADGSNVKGIVFISSKPDNFIAGADIKMLGEVQKSREFEKLTKMTMGAHKKFEDELCKLPMVAAIHGACLGGGLEFALKCSYRIATTGKQTQLGLPEVKLGLLPGWGGTYALTRLIGLMDALPMMLQGGSKNATQAKKLGLVDAVCDLPSLEALAVAKCTAFVTGAEKTKKPKKSWTRWLMETPMGSDYVLKKAKEQVMKATRGKYPAPFEVLSCAKYALTASSPMAAFENEAKSFSKLAATSESAALLGLFEGSTALKKNHFTLKKKGPKPTSVGVLGAGLMGAGIAQISAAKGLNVVLKDRDAASVAKGLAHVDAALTKQVQRKRLTAYEKNTTMSRLQGFSDATSDGYARRVKECEVIIEAVFEDLDLKHTIIKDLEELIPDSTVIATNTSAIPIGKIAAKARRPERIVGMHYFSPVPMMPLLEVIPHAGTSDDAMRLAFQVGMKQGKTCIEVKDVPGFFVNRCLSPMMAEIAPLFAEGVTPTQLDEAVLDLGFPVGPITLCDEVGVDVAYKTATTMIADPTMGKRMAGSDLSFQKTMMEKKWLGRKTGKGFFIYDGKKKTPNAELADYIEKQIKTTDSKLPLATIQDRYICRFINEAAKSLEDGVINSPVDGDIGSVFGVGFPPFLGGPFKLLDLVGAQIYVDKMSKLAQTYGERFEPCDLLKDHAKKSGAKFHP